MTPLDQILHQYGSDKSSVHANPHGYATHYEGFFEPLRNEPIKLLEIGVADGHSIRAWLDYFPKAEICGVEITPGNAIEHERYVQVTGDQGSAEFWNSFIQEHGSGWGVVIDDGSHRSADIITSFRALWPHVRPGGIYAIEDLYCSYLPELQTPGAPDTITFIRSLMDEMNHGVSGIDHLHFSRELAIFKKK